MHDDSFESSKNTLSQNQVFLLLATKIIKKTADKERRSKIYETVSEIEAGIGLGIPA
jgi:hypothetical protein